MSEGQDWNWGYLTVRSHVRGEGTGLGRGGESLYIEVQVCRGLGLGWGGGPCMVRSNASWVMVTWDLRYGQNDR